MTCFGRYHRELAKWQESRIRIINRIESVRNESEARLRQFLHEEQAAASRNQFQRARELKSESESERIEAERSIRMLQVRHGLWLSQPDDAQWHAASSFIVEFAQMHCNHASH